MDKHTPGPWHLTKGLYGKEDEITIWGVKNEEGCSGFIGTLGNMQGEDEANANLIAAAPELLEALEILVKQPDTYSVEKAFVKARAAIAKAKGEA